MIRMRLHTVLLLLILPLWLLLAAALYGVGLHHTRDFLQQKMASHAQDGATALALRIAPDLAANDAVAVANAVDALFDSGYYREITLLRADGQVLLTRTHPLRVQGVPDWFVRRLPVAAPIAQAEASAGWRRLAQVRVQSHPGHAHAQLWATARDSLVWGGGILLVLMPLLVLLIARALRPVRDMEALALAVAHGRFPRLARQPWVRDLGRIAAALDHMSAAVAGMLAEQSAQVERLRAELLTDAATGLANRAYFEAELAHAAGAGACGVLLVQLDGLAQYNAQHGRAAGDRLVLALARALQAAPAPHGARLARLAGAQFAVLAPEPDADRLMSLAQAQMEALQALLRHHQAQPPCRVHAGVACLGGCAPGELLAAADAALRDAARGPSGSVRLAPGAAPGRTALRQRLAEAVADDRLGLAWQPLRRCADAAEVHVEAFARLPGGDGEALGAGAFVSLAEDAELAGRLDRLVIAHAWRAAGQRPGAVTVNVSGASLAQADFVAWLGAHVTPPARLGLEYTPGGDHHQAAALAALHGLKAQGFVIILDRCAPDRHTLEQIAALRPHWIKLEGGLCRYAETHAAVGALLATLVGYAHGLGVQVAATGVETEAQARSLCALGCDAVQGWVHDADLHGHDTVTHAH